jgi:hypothetical protein
MFDMPDVDGNSVKDVQLSEQLQGMFQMFMVAMQEENAKVTAKLESKIDKLAENLDTKLAEVSERLDAKLNLVVKNMDVKLEATITNVTVEMRKENEQIRKENSYKIETKIQEVTKEVELVKKGTFIELAKCMQKCNDESNKVNENVRSHKVQTEAKLESLKVKVDQNREETETKLEELIREVKTITSMVDECNGRILRDKKSHCSEIKRLDAQLNELKQKVNSNIIDKTEATASIPPQASDNIRLENNNQATSRESQYVQGTSGVNSVKENVVMIERLPDGEQARNVRIVGATGSNIVSAPPDRYVDLNQYNELSMPKFTDSSQQVAVYFVRELDKYFLLKKTPEELRLPLVFRAITDTFAKQWMITAYGKLESYSEFKTKFTELLWDAMRQAEIRCKVYQDRYDSRAGENFTEHYIRYATMASMLSPVMSDQDLLSALMTHYEPRIQTCLISASVKSTQDAIAVLTKLQSIENLSEMYNTSWKEYDRRDYARGTQRSQFANGVGNRRTSEHREVRHIRQENRERNYRASGTREMRENEISRGSFCGQGEK